MTPSCRLFCAANLLVATAQAEPFLQAATHESWCPHHGGSLMQLLSGEPPGFVLEVGSFDGSGAIAFARAGHRVWSFEPSPGKFEPTKKKIIAAGLAAKIYLFGYALSNVTGSAPFVVNRAGYNGKKMFKGELGSEQDGLGTPLWKLDNKTTAVVQVP